MPIVTRSRPTHKTISSAPLEIQTTLFDLAAAIDAVCEPDNSQTAAALMQYIINSSRVTFTNGPTKWRFTCNHDHVE